MKSKILILTLLCAALVAFPSLSTPAEMATAEDAVQMVEMAGKMIEEMGDAALAEISDPSGRCFDCERNLYVFVYSDDVVLLAHPLRQNVVGVSFSRHPEDYGNEPVSVTVSNMIVEKAVKDGSGWTDYPAEIPGTFKISMKHTYEKLFRHAGKNYIVCCGVW